MSEKVIEIRRLAGPGDTDLGRKRGRLYVLKASLVYIESSKPFKVTR